MIKRVDDFGGLSTNDLEKIANVVSKKENSTLFDIFEDENKALLAQKELKIQGYQAKIEPFGNKWKVIAIVPDKVKFEEAVNSGMFKKLAWGRYSFQRESALGMFKYEFDEGSIWRVMTGEDGQEYLIKEVDDENEDDVVRIKTASKVLNQSLVNDDNVKNVLSVLYDNTDKEILSDILSSNLKEGFYTMLNEKLSKAITAKIENNHFISSPEYVNDIKSIVKIALDNKELDSNAKMEKLICDYTNSMVARTGKMNKLFD